MYKKSLLFSAVIVLLMAFADTAMADANIVAYWKMDEPNTVDPRRIDDYSGNDNHGIFNNLEAGVSPPLVDGGPARYAPGIVNNFLDINGRWRTDEHSFESVTVPDDDTLDFGTGDFTISMWFDMMGGGNSPLLNKGAPGGPGYQLRIGDNKDLYFAISDGTNVTECTTGQLGVGWLEHYNWEHFAAVRDGSELKLYHNGQLVGTKTVITTGSIDNSQDLLMGRDPDADLTNHASGWDQAEWDAHPWVDGQYDDVRLYNKALSPDDFNTVFPYAWGFLPEDHAENVLSSTALSWKDGSISKNYDVYLGTDHDNVYNATTTTPLGVYKGRVLNDGNEYELTSLNLETAYYWRIDSLDDANNVLWTSKIRKKISGIWYDLVWEFASAGLKAAVPSPKDEAINQSQDSNLAWMPGAQAASHDVYFGTSENDVNSAVRLLADINADGSINFIDFSVMAEQWSTNPGAAETSADLDGNGNVNYVDLDIFADDWLQPQTFKANLPLENTAYDLPTLSLGTTYYWRIDELDSGGQTVKGDVWNFKTAPIAEPLLFVYFEGGGELGVFLAYSYDGLHWAKLNGGKPIITPPTGYVTRDPSIVRAPDGTFHMVYTGGYRDTDFGYASSTDLINWSEQKYILVMQNEPNAVNCWAPELFYDDVEEEFMIFWSSTVPGKFPETDGQGPGSLNHRIYYCTTTDFQTFSDSALLYNDGFNVIDAAIVKDANQYIMFVKDETNYPIGYEKNIKMAFSTNAQGPYGPASEPITGEYACEGPSAIKIADTWYVYFDKFLESAYGAVTSTDLENWDDISDTLDFPDSFNHGTVFAVPTSILDNLLEL